MSDQDSRTQPATPHRREQALAQGLAPATPEVALVVVGLACLAVLRELPGSLSASFAGLVGALWTPDTFSTLAKGDLGPAALRSLAPWPPCAPIIVVVPIAITLAFLVQKGFRIAPARISLDLSRIAPRVPVGAADLVESPARGLFRLAIACWIGWRLARAALARGGFGPIEPEIEMGLIGLASRLLVELSVLAVAVSLADWAYRRWQFERSIMMTPDEVLLEQRSIEGDPRIRAEMESRMESRLGGASRRGKVLLVGGGRALLVGLSADPRATPIVLAWGAGREATVLRESADRLGVASVSTDQLDRIVNPRVGSTIPSSLFGSLAPIHARLFPRTGSDRSGRC